MVDGFLDRSGIDERPVHSGGFGPSLTWRQCGVMPRRELSMGELVHQAIG